MGWKYVEWNENVVEGTVTSGQIFCWNQPYVTFCDKNNF